MVATMTTTTEIEGTVARVGSYGFTLQGREGWVSLSKFAEPRPDLPAEGQRVRVGLDKSGYARTVDVLSAPVPARGAEMPENAPAATEAAQSAPDRDRRIMRQAVLNTATALLASGGRAAALPDVLTVAEALERWVLRA